MRRLRALFSFTLLLAYPLADGRAADHREAPALLSNPSADITDVYTFVSPQNPDNVIVIANFVPDAPPEAGFPKRGIQLHFDLDGNAIADRSFTFKFGNSKKDGAQKVKATLSGSPDASLNRKLVKGKTTAPGDPPRFIDARAGITAFAGLVDDPFFGDMRALDRPFVCPPGVDSYAGKNVLSIVLELPPGVFVPGASQVPPFGLWVETKRDSMGAPLTNRGLMPPNKLVASGDPREKNRFNSTPPDRQRAEFFVPIRETFAVFNTALTAEQLASDTFPDVLFLDPARPSGFPNGRRLEDDVIDVVLFNVTGGIEDDDCVPGNDVPFRTVFPYAASPHGG